jgi:hypothetical protein
MQPLLLRSAVDRHTHAAELPQTLVVDDSDDHDGIPPVTGELPRSAGRPLRLLLRVHNAAGVPIVAGETRVDAGATRIEFRDLRALGIEAYAHVPAEERARITRRIWSRRAYGVIEAAE